MDEINTDNVLWRITRHDGFHGLELEQNVPVKQIGDYSCMVKIEAASLNFRDLMIAQGTFPFPMNSNVVPGSDGAGTVIAVGKLVTRFKSGDKIAQSGLGASLDGVLQRFGAFDEEGLVSMPQTLTFREACTLPCAAVTAWNALYGLPGKALRPGDTILTLGTGGVSLFAIQLAVAAGATVISTTSSTTKADKVKALGVSHTINYREDPSWGYTAKSLTPGGSGFDFIVEVGGATTLSQSVSAIKIDGLIVIAGSIGSEMNATGDPGMLSVWTSTCITRGIAVGSRAQFEEMIRAFEAMNIHPVVDNEVFKLKDIKEAYQYMWEQQNFRKVVIECW